MSEHRTPPGISWRSGVTRRRWAHLLAILGVVAGTTTAVAVTPTPATPTASANGCTTSFGGGDGTDQQPFIITSAAHLVALAADPLCFGYAFQQEAHITLTQPLTPIATGSAGTFPAGTPFSGTYDGGGYKIMNATITASTGVGLFGYADGTTFMNIWIDSASVSASSSSGAYAGALVGDANNVMITNVTVSASSVTGDSNLGAVFGSASGSTISAVTVIGGAMEATDRSNAGAGGLGGYLSQSSITGARVEGSTIEGAGDYVGGLIGRSEDGVFAAVAITSATVSGTGSVGGLIGQSYAGVVVSTIIDASIDDTHVSGGSNVGGVLGYAYVENNLGSDNGEDSIDDDPGRVGRLDTGSQPMALVLSRVVVTDTAVEGAEYSDTVGGLIGYTETYAQSILGIIQSAVIDSTVSADSYAVGGLVGRITAYDEGFVLISESFAANASISASSQTAARVGGLVGQIEATPDDEFGGAVQIDDSFATAHVVGAEQVGGLIGEASADEGGTITVARTFAAGPVTISAGTGPIGGLLGELAEDGGTVSASASFWDQIASDVTTDAFPTGTTGLGTLSMQQTKTPYESTGWAIKNGPTPRDGKVWGFCPDGYPFLLWSPPVGASCADDGGDDSTDTLPPPPPPGGGSVVLPEPSRVGGATRVDTAVAISQEFFAAGVPVVYLATGSNFADALVAGAAAGYEGGPVLLTDRDVLPASTLAELRRLGPGRIVVVGGTSVISTAVFAALAGEASAVVRIGGDDRYETAALLSRDASTPPVPVAYVATGETYADAIAGGPAAGLDGAPVLLVQQNAIPAATAAELVRLDPDRIVVLGLTAAVSAGVEAQLAAYAPVVQRIGGADRYGTAAALSASKYLPGVEVVFLATGTGFADALSAVPPATVKGGPVLLTRPTCIPQVVLAELERLRPGRIVVLGGESALADAVSNLTACPN